MAVLTITTTSEQDARIAPAFGAKRRLPGNASVADIKADLIEYVKNVVQRYEAQQAADNVVPIDDPT